MRAIADRFVIAALKRQLAALGRYSRYVAKQLENAKDDATSEFDVILTRVHRLRYELETVLKNVDNSG